VIKGDLVKFADAHWFRGREAELMEHDTRLVVMGTAAAWVRWSGGKPTKYIVRQPGTPFPERDQLGDEDPAAWELGPDDKSRDPWMATRFVHMTNPVTAALYTFSTSSWGGRNAVIDLADAVVRYRHVRPGACPVVTLGSAPMPTKFGKKWRPVFQIVDWVGGDGAIVEDKPKPEMKVISGSASNRMLDDLIPFAPEWR
jgi:hypothetical protein